jgi:hypothetical protein
VTTFLLCFAAASVLVIAGIVIGALCAKIESEPDLDDPSYEAACAWRSINLALGNPDHYDACDELADLRRAGWHIEKSGNERAGFVYLKFITPDHKE